MAIKIMSRCWDVTGLTSTQKLVLLSLADQADDNGLCWPSIGTTSRRTSVCESATRRAIAELEKMGHLTRNFQVGKPTFYTINPCTKDTPVSDTPLYEVLDTPVSGTRHPCTRSKYNRQESSITQTNTSSGDDMGVDSQTVMDTGELHIDQPDLLDQVTTKPEIIPPHVPANPPVDCEAVANLYNEILPELPSVKLLTDKRRRSIRSCARVRKGFESLEFWGDYFRSVRESEFLMGRRTPWKADFDFLTTASKFTKVIEGSYS